MDYQAKKRVTLFQGALIKVVIGLDILLFLLLTIFRSRPDYADRFYFRGLYPILTLIMGGFTDLSPISLTELMIAIFIVTILVRIGAALTQLFQKKRTFRSLIIPAVRQIFIVSSFIMCWFYFMWGFNYMRPLMTSQRADLFPRQSIDDQYLEEVLLFFIERSNTLYEKSKFNEKTVNKIVDIEVKRAIEELSGQRLYPAGRIKKLLSGSLKRLNVLGVVSPFLLEGHISTETFESELPFLIAHEKSHLYGYTHETEANFIAFYSCVTSKKPYLNYSAYSEILDYLLGEYKRRVSRERYSELYITIRPEIRELHKDKRERYLKYSSKLNDRFWELYDLYLKANKVEEGNKAYSLVVQMLLKTELLEELMAGEIKTLSN